MTAPAAQDARRGYGARVIFGTSTVGFSDATDHAIARAFAEDPQLGWYEVTTLSGTFRSGRVLEWEVRIAVGRGEGPTAADGIR